jgi:membrane-bound ClpP family serine protease
VIALGWLSVALAVVLLLAEAHLPTGGVSGGVALVALVCGVVLLLIGASPGVLAILAVSLGVSVAWTGGLVLLARSLQPSRRLPRSGRGTSTVGNSSGMST